MKSSLDSLGTTQKIPVEITCDQECHLESRIKKAISMALALKERCTSGPDQVVYDKAFEGIIEGTILEILKIFNLKLKE